MIRRVVGLLAGLTALLLLAPVLAPALAPVLTPSLAGAHAHAASLAGAEDADPLQVTITRISPSVIPRRGPLQLSGTITNVSDETWSLINLYAVVSASPIVTGRDLELNAETDPALQVGNRIVEDDTDTFDLIEELAAGASAPYSLKVPQDVLTSYLSQPTAPGVYWLGVQALGQTTEGRDNLSSGRAADGRARTFIPFLARPADQVRAAFVVPIRRSVSYRRHGRLGAARTWMRDLAPGGRLDNLLDFGAGAPPGAVTWLIDPAVLEAVRRIAAGNPPRDLGPVSDGNEEPSPSSEESSGESAAAGGEGGTALPGDSAARWAGEWLDRVAILTRSTTVLGLPYGDVDMAAANDLDPQVAVRALGMSANAFQDFGIAADPTVAPPSGYLSAISVAGLENQVTILASDAVLSEPPGNLADYPTTIAVNDHDVHLYDGSASLGGPGPTDPFADLAVRQRLISEAALLTLGNGTEPLVVSMPSDWNPGAIRAGFFTGLDVPWLSLVPLPSLTPFDPPRVAAGDLRYPRRENIQELDGGNFVAVDRLLQAGATLQSVLTESATIEREVAAQALTTASYSMRDDPTEAAVDAAVARRTIHRLFKRIRISAPPYVTLSSTSGRFRVDLSNDLAQPVAVKIKPLVVEELEIEGPSRIVIEGNRITSVFLQVRSPRLGVHQVRLVLTDEEGTRLGPTADLPIRSSQSGRVIWVIIGVGAALLFGAIGLRLFRRLMGRTAG